MIRIDKTIIKLKLRNFWCIGEHESWFSDMAYGGFHLKKVGKIFIQFTQDEPRQMRYRIDLSKDKKITLEQEEMYLAKGWDYVTSYGEFNVCSSPVALNAPELYMNPEDQPNISNLLDERLIKIAWVIIGGILSMILALLEVGIFDWGLYFALADGRIIQQITIVIAFLYAGYNSLQEAVSINILRRTFSEQIHVNHCAPWKMKYTSNLMISSIFMACVVIAAGITLMQLTMNKKQTLPINNNDLPIVRLADIEQNINIEREINIQKDVDMNNYYSDEWSIFSQLQYKSYENGVVLNETGRKNLSTLRTWEYKLKNPSVKYGLIDDLIKKYGGKSEDYLEISHPEFEKLIVYDIDSLKLVFAAKGKGVIYIRYDGNKNMDAIIEVVAEKINLISD